MAGFDLASIIADATSLSGEQTQQANQIAGLAQNSQNLSNQAADAIQTAGNLSAQAELVKQQGQLQTQQNNAKAAVAFGTSVGDVSDIITSLGNQMRDTASQLVTSQAKVTDIEKNSDIINNPLGWLTDLLQGDAARSERDAYAKQFDTLQKTAQGLNAQTQSTVMTQNAITQTLSAASIQQTAEATQKLAEAKALDARIQGNQYGVQAVEALYKNGATEFNRQMQVYNQVTEDERWKEGMALRKEQFLAMQEQRKRGKQEDQYYVDAATQVNTYRSSAGLPPMNQTQIRAQINQAGKIGDTIRDQQTQGFQIQQQGNTARMFGDTPAQTVSTLLRDKPTLPPSFAPAKQVLDESAGIAGTEIGKKSNDPLTGAEFKKDKQAQARVYDDTVNAYATKAQSDIQSGKGNPYEAVPIETVLAAPNGIKESKFGQLVLQTLVSTGQPSPTPDLLLATATSAVAKGDISFNEARDGITSFYSNAVGIKNATGGFLQLGVKLQEGYKTKVQAFNQSIFDSIGSGLVSIGGNSQSQYLEALGREQRNQASKPIDLTKSTDVTLALTVMKSKDVSQKILQNAQGKN